MVAMMRPRLLVLAAAIVSVAAAAIPGTASASPFASSRGAIYSHPEAPGSPACDAHFCVHWVAQGADAPDLKDSNGDGVPDYVERVLAIAAHVHQVENVKLGWREPQGDGTLGGGHDKTDIYLTEVGPNLFGYSEPDPDQRAADGRPAVHQHAFLVLDSSYDPFNFPGTQPGHDLKVTFAHEYNHVLQYGYDAYRDDWFAESSAVWMEDQVYNGINDYLRYVGLWTKLWDTPLTRDSPKEYGSAVWNEWLAHHYGRTIIRKVWAGADRARPQGYAIAAYERAIRAAGPSTFGRDFSRFAADVAEWRTGIGFRESYLYPDVPRQGSLALGSSARTLRLNHTTFGLLGVPARGGREVVVQAEAPAGVAAGLALVGRIGSERQGHTVKDVDYAEDGGELTARLPDPGRFSRITAVLVNADTKIAGYSRGHRDWRYLGNDEPFRVSGQIVR
jgi:Family of unknown function (DUF6055)